MVVWHLLRGAALMRHYVFWQTFDGKPETWAVHMAMIRSFYGY